MKQRLSGPDSTKTSGQIAALTDLSVSEPKDRWRSAYGTEPPPRTSRKLLVLAGRADHIHHRQDRIVIGMIASSTCSSRPASTIALYSSWSASAVANRYSSSLL